MLVTTQQMEAYRIRRMEEGERRFKQMKLRQAMSFEKDRREVAHTFAKQFLRHMKRDTVQQLIDLGNLRSDKEYSFGAHFEAPLYNQVNIYMHQNNDVFPEAVSDLIGKVAHKQAKNHGSSIAREMDRRKAEVQKKIREKERIEKETAVRRKKRANLREKLRIHEMEKEVNDLIQLVSPFTEWRPSIPIYDLRPYMLPPQYDHLLNQLSDLHTQGPAAYIPGGLLGEILLSLQCLFNLGLRRQIGEPKGANPYST